MPAMPEGVAAALLPMAPGLRPSLPTALAPGPVVAGFLPEASAASGVGRRLRGRPQRAQGVGEATSVPAAASAAALGGVAAAFGAALGARQRRSQCNHGRCRDATLVALCAAKEAVATLTVDSPAAPAQKEDEDLPPPGRPLQIVKIDLETNRVVLGEEELQIMEDALRRSGVQKVAVVGVMGAFRTGKSFLLDMMLRYLREGKGGMEKFDNECEVPAWAMEKNVPAWALRCGDTLLEGREGGASTELSGFTWRPGMEKCTEGVWLWSEVFVRKAGDEDVAVVLMDTQGAWDARMTKEQSATVFGLTTLVTSRLIYNVSKQIQQDKIENLLYFTDFARAALRTQGGKTELSTASGPLKPFQKLEFLVRDWPHFPEGATVKEGRTMMQSHLRQYMDPEVTEDTNSVEALEQAFNDIDIWCLPHPSLEIERASWTGDLAVVEPSFWRFIDSYMDKVFGPKELKAKTTLGTEITVDTFATVLREFTASFKNAAPQAKSFAEAMEASTSLTAKDIAMKLLKKTMNEEAGEMSDALAPKEFEKVASNALEKAEAEFKGKAIFGSTENIRKVAAELKADATDELRRLREENERKLEASLTGLTNASLAAVAAFGVDKVSDLTCDWWSGFCRELSTDLSVGYWGVLAYVLYSLNNINSKQGQLDATVAALELFKSMTKTVKRLTDSVEQDFASSDAKK